MSKVELSVSPKYVCWNVWPCLREFLQNAKDADDLGKKMTVEYDAKTSTLSISNVGAKLDRSNLILGGSAKKEIVGQRGQYGEGMKIAFANLLRLEKKVVISNDDELWVPSIVQSPIFNAEVLQMEITAQEKSGALVVKVEGITPEEWTQTQNNVLFLPTSTNHGIALSNGGKILTDQMHANRLYCQGIFVSEMPKKHFFGYDFSGLKLDRDRQMCDGFAVQSRVKAALEHAFVSGGISQKLLFDILMHGAGEAEAVQDDVLGITKKLAAGMMSEFELRYGNESLPATSPGDALALSNSGIRGVVLPTGLVYLLNRTGTTDCNVRLAKALTVVKRYKLDELSLEEAANFLWAIQKVYKVEKFDPLRVSVVDFLAKNIFGCYKGDHNGGDIMIGKFILADKKELIATVVHEVAHKYGKDGTPQHRAAIEKIFGAIVCAYEESANPPQLASGQRDSGPADVAKPSEVQHGSDKQS